MAPAMMNVRTSVIAPPLIWLLTIFSVLVVGVQAFPNNQPLYSPRPYTVNVASRLIEETLQKVSSFRPSQDVDQPAWTYGPPTSEITAIVKYWVEEYSWSDVQAEINANFSHYMTTVPPPGGAYNRSLDIHFIHQRSARVEAIPMLMLHGWPSTSLEWEKVIPALVDPGKESRPAFHIIIPNIPNFRFSPAPTTPNLRPSEHGAVFASLMQQLGYEEYAV
jgi:pimeloyl-ACP methyl ester carboxylesterase